MANLCYVIFSINISLVTDDYVILLILYKETYIFLVGFLF
jgi:hypothetical protein